MIPYYSLPDLVIQVQGLTENLPTSTNWLRGLHDLHELRIHPFGALVATGTILGYSMVVNRAMKEGMPRAKIESFLNYMLGFGFVGAHVLDMLMYDPGEVLRDPWKLLRIWEGIGSFGGFIGGTIGILLWKRKYDNAPIMPVVENIATIFPISWIFGRAGCSIAHDHPGLISNSFLAVHFPPAPLVYAARQTMEAGYTQTSAERMSHYSWGTFDWSYYYLGFADSTCAGKPVVTLARATNCAMSDWPARFDLGLLEWLCTIPMAAFIYWYASKPRKLGQILGALSMIYAPVRFALDSLRATDITNADARFMGLTPAQWLAIALFGFGLQLFLRAKDREPIAPTTESKDPASEPEKEASDEKAADEKVASETPAEDKPAT